MYERPSLDQTKNKQSNATYNLMLLCETLCNQVPDSHTVGMLLNRWIRIIEPQVLTNFVIF